MDELIGADEVEQHPPLICGLLRRGEIMNIIASPKARKSWLVLELATCLAHGAAWLSRFQCAKSSVLLIDNELRLPTLRQRAAAVRQAKGIVGNNGVKILSVRGKPFGLGDIGRYAKAAGADVVVLDALYRFFPNGFDENSNADMTKLYNQLDSIATDCDISIVVIHHASKGAQTMKSVTDVGSGAGAQSRAADAHLVLRAVKADGDQARENAATLDAVARSFAPTERLLLRWEYPRWRLADTSVSFSEVKSAMPLDVFVEKYFGDGWGPSMSIQATAKADGVSKRQFYNYLRRALTQRLIEEQRAGRSREYRKTPDGRAL
jgi:hypothetical protein